LKPHFEEGKVPIAAMNSNTHKTKVQKGIAMAKKESHGRRRLKKKSDSKIEEKMLT
jgi:hypothetical protein